MPRTNYTALGRLKSSKQRGPETIIGVLGCMAQKDQHQIFQRAPHVDLVVGPGQLAQLPALLEQVAAGGGPRIEVSLDRTGGNRQSVRQSLPDSCLPEEKAATGVHAERPTVARAAPGDGADHVRLRQVLHVLHRAGVRGPEQSRPAAEIVDEVRRLADDGCLEITLLGQTVNSYRDATGPQTIRLADRSYRFHDIQGIRRLKFVTNHPQYMSDDLLAAMRDLPKVSPYLHVPAQSGSNAVLQRMKRGYTVE